MRIAIGIQSVNDEAHPLTVENLVNLYAEQAPLQAKAPVILRRPPGLTLHCTLPKSPIYGMHEYQNRLYAIAGYGTTSKLYRVLSDGTYSAVDGVVNAFGPMVMADNGVDMVMVNSISGSASFRLDGEVVSTETNGSVALIDDADYPGAVWVGFIAGFYVFIKPASAQIFIPETSYSATAFNAQDVATAETDPADLVAGAITHTRLILFGKRNTELWYYSGNVNFPFQRNSSAVIERGCLAASSVVNEDNTVYWLAEDKIIYRLDGSRPVRVSDHQTEQKIAAMTSPSTAIGSVYTHDGHKFYSLLFPEDAKTLVYDIATQLWTERKSKGLTHWRGQYTQRAYGEQFVADYLSGNIYKVDRSVVTENGDRVVAEMTFPPFQVDDRNMLFMSRFELECETGKGLTTGQGSDPQAMLEWSDDGGRTWSNEHWRSLGKIGQYRTRALWHRLGSFRHRTFRVSVSDNVRFSVTGAFAAMIKGYQ